MLIANIIILSEENMCRVLIYLGKDEVNIYELLYASDNALSHQSYAPQLMERMHNLAGFGFCAWSNHSFNPKEPYYYRTTELPFFDKNLYRLSKKICASCFLAHIRGVEYSIHEIVNNENAHPFKYDFTELAFAHNGFLPQFFKMKAALIQHIKPHIFTQMNGTTDSEFIYALFLSQFEDCTKNITRESVKEATIATLKMIKKIRDEHGIIEAAPLNLFITNGRFVLVSRYILNFGQVSDLMENAVVRYYTLWVTFGEKYGLRDGQYKMWGEERKSILFASEPLTIDKTTWIELPEYSITTAWLHKERVIFHSEEIAL